MLIFDKKLLEVFLLLLFKDDVVFLSFTISSLSRTFTEFDNSFWTI